MSLDSRTRVALVGCGHWGPNYLSILSTCPDCHVVYACDVDKTQLERVASQYPHLRVTTSLQTILNDPDVHAVIIATPTRLHCEMALAAIEAGKDVLVEKPMATKLDAAELLVRRAEELQRILMVGHTFLYNPGIRKLKELIDAGRLGRLYYLTATRTHLGLVREDVNAAWDLAPHDISIFSYLLGKRPVTVSSVGTCVLQDGREDVVFITVTYPEKVIANIHVSWCDSNKQRKIHVIGSAARAVFDDIEPLERVKIYEKGIASNVSSGSGFDFPYLLRDGDIYSPKIEVKEPLREMWSHFLECVRLRKQPFTGGAAGLEVVRVMCAIDESMAGDGTPVVIR